MARNGNPERMASVRQVALRDPDVGGLRYVLTDSSYYLHRASGEKPCGKCGLLGIKRTRGLCEGCYWYVRRNGYMHLYPTRAELRALEAEEQVKEALAA